MTAMPEIQTVATRCHDCGKTFTVRVTKDRPPKRFCTEACFRRFAYRLQLAHAEAANPPVREVIQPVREVSRDPDRPQTEEERVMRRCRFEDEPNIPVQDGRRLAWR